MMSLTLAEVIAATGAETLRPLPPLAVCGVSTDSRTCRAGEVFFALRGPRFDGHDFVDDVLARGAAAAVVERAAADDGRAVLRVPRGVAALGRLANHYRRERAATVIAVTGSNGKTTTKAMIDHVLSRRLPGRGSAKSYNNAVGVPLTLLSVESGDAYVVVELGTNAPGEIAQLSAMANPNIGVITSIGPAHLAGLGDLRGVVAEKLSLLGAIRPGGLALVRDDVAQHLPRGRRREDCTLVTFGFSAGADLRVGSVAAEVDSVSFTINDQYAVRMPVPGAHNALNAAAAFGVARRMGLEAQEIIESLARFEMPEMRLNVIRVGEFTVVDDSYNANPGSAEAAVEVLRSARGGRRVFVAGDMLELGDRTAWFHGELGKRVARSGIELLVAVGEHGDATVAGARAAGGDVETLTYLDTESACRALPERLQRTDTVLIKGSRRLGLDRLVRRMREVFA